MIAPLLRHPRPPGPPLDLGGVQGLLATSANGVRAFAAREHAANLPVYAVGDATARTARAKVSGRGRVRPAMSRRWPGWFASVSIPRPALCCTWPAPRSPAISPACSRRPDSLSPGSPVRGARGRAPAADAADVIGESSLRGVILYSPRTAATFVDLVRKAGLAEDCRRLTAICLSRAVADRAAALSWKRIAVAARADQSAVIEAVISVDKSASIG